MSAPLNKGGEEGPPRHLPQINNRLTIAVLEKADQLTKGVRGRLRRRTPIGQEERFRGHLLHALRTTPLGAEAHREGTLDADVTIRTAFGKPPLITIDIILRQPQADFLTESGPASVMVEDLLRKATQLIWDNPEICPAAIRGRVMALGPAEEEVTLIDMTAIGYSDEMARPEDLYFHYGAPLADPHWHP